jgi:hypothetical protein
LIQKPAQSHPAKPVKTFIRRALYPEMVLRRHDFNKKASQGGFLKELVAGAGFEPTTFGL